MTHKYDAIIIGAGHNGLVTAAYLGKAGYKVLVLEQRDALGGVAATEETFPGFKFNTGAHDAGLFRAEVIAGLNLRSYGLDFVEPPVALFAPQPDGRALTLWRDPRQNQAEIGRFSEADAEKYPEYVRLFTTLTGMFDGIMTLTPPKPTASPSAGKLPWLQVGLNLKRLGKRNMMEFLRVLPMPVTDFLDEWFESDALKGALGASGVTGSLQGPRAAGTVLMMLYQSLGLAAGAGFRASRFARGGMGQLIAALAAAAQDQSVEICAGAGVSRINVDDGRATGVTLAGGEQINARIIVSNADPRRTLFGLIGPQNLEVKVMRRVRNIRLQGTTAKVNLALKGLPKFTALNSEPETENPELKLGGHIIINPGLDYLERAYDDAKYGNFSQQPYLDVVIPTLHDSSLAPDGQHVMSITMQYAPYHLAESTWDEQSEALGDKIIDTLTQYAPNLKELILHRQIITPLDWERDYGLTEGGIFHGQMGLDQLLFMRPIAGFAQYRAPVDNLYLCGAGTHPGGGVTGAPGYNAAREIIADLKK